MYFIKIDNGNYRFLLDGSEEDPEEYKAIFFPKSELFDKVYKTQKMHIVNQSKNVEHIWLSMVYPIVKEGKTQGLLVLDLSESYAKHLNDFNSPLMKVIWMMQIFLLISLVLLIFLGYRFYRLRRNLLIDKLTLVYTKVYLDELFNREPLDSYNAILLDIDRFKEINTKYSFEFGDIILRKFTKTLKSLLSQKSKIIRTGGTEFLIMIPKEDVDIKILTQKIFQALTEKKYLLENEIITLTVSMSAVDIPEGTVLIQNIQRILDQTLLEVKNGGKNNFKILELNSLNQVRYGNINYIKDALEEERLMCLFQPIYKTKTKKIVKYEALVRLIDEEDSKKYITPYYFMKTIKGTSQYLKMSKQVFSYVFSTLEKYPDIELSVNVDLHDLENPDMMKLISENLFKHSDIANRLTFEILEDNEIKDYVKVQYIIQQLKAFGSKVALDDFGSGYTNYHYLVSLDIDVLKIDGSLIKELKVAPERTKLILKSIQELAQNLDVELVAEFVSDSNIYEIMKELNIEYVQGYYLGEPKPINAYIA